MRRRTCAYHASCTVWDLPTNTQVLDDGCECQRQRNLDISQRGLVRIAANAGANSMKVFPKRDETINAIGAMPLSRSRAAR